MINLEQAIAIAVQAHAGKKDKGGAPYILHPLRVMISLEREDERIVAVLHDVLEDGPIELRERVEAELEPRLLASLKLVTKTEEDHRSHDYMAFIRRLAEDPLARHVKMADLRDNLSVLRLKMIGEQDRDRLNQYLEAYRYLESIQGRHYLTVG